MQSAILKLDGTKSSHVFLQVLGKMDTCDIHGLTGHKLKV